MSAARHALPAAAALLLPLTPATAQRSSNCATLALLADPDSNLSRLGLALRRDGTMDLTFAGKSDVLTGADDCDFEGPADDFEVACEWSADSYGAALSRFNFLRVTLDGCLEAEMELKEVPYGSDAYRVLRSFSGSVEEDGEDYRSVDISLDLVERNRESSAAEYSVSLEFLR